MSSFRFFVIYLCNFNDVLISICWLYIRALSVLIRRYFTVLLWNALVQFGFIINLCVNCFLAKNRTKHFPKKTQSSNKIKQDHKTFISVFLYFLQILLQNRLWKGDYTLRYVPPRFWYLPDIFKFLKILSLTSFGDLNDHYQDYQNIIQNRNCWLHLKGFCLYWVDIRDPPS